MSDSTGNIRRGALEAGQKTAQIVIFICMIGLVGAFLSTQPGAGESAEEPAQVSAPLRPTQTPRQSLILGGIVTATAHPDQTRTPDPAPAKSPTAAASPTAASRTPSPSVTAAPSRTPGPTATVGPRVPHIGIVAGHWWLAEDGRQSLDVGAVCDEGTAYELTEVEINLDVAQRVFFALHAAGYDTDLLQEWDERLDDYQADVLVSIHADACLYPEASGFKVARVADSHLPEIEDRLVDCLIESYQSRTGLAFHSGSITADMARYHTFYEIDPNTPGAIIEVGFMLADRRLLTQRADLVAQGIIDGILCFLEGEGITLESGR
jgi:N-acetylmuramoyl-L-alanine amidase